MKLLGNWAEKLRRFSAKRGFTCDRCGVEIFNYPKRRLCDSCDSALVRSDGCSCQKCGRKATDNGVCLDCKAHVPAFERGFSPLVYKGESAGLINRFKGGNRRLAYCLGEEAADFFFQTCELCKNSPSEEILLIPVPLTKEREQKRGYNQAAELALVVEERLLGNGVNAKTDLEILIKRKETSQQKHLGFRERAENVVGVYHVQKRAACKNRTVLLIDDIMTTGATGDACAKALKRAGAKMVYFLAVAALEERKK